MSSRDRRFLAHLGKGSESQELKDHLVAVSRLASIHSRSVGVPAAGALIGLVHDLGKYSSAFQAYLSRMSVSQDTEEHDVARGQVDHSTAGAQYIWNRLQAKGKLDAIVREILALCVASHHSGLIDCVSPDGTENLSRRIAKSDASSHLKEVIQNQDARIAAAAADLIENPRFVGEIAGIIRQIAVSNPNDSLCRFQVGLLTRFLFSCLIDADRTDTANFANPAAASLRQDGKYSSWAALADHLEERLEKFADSNAIDRWRRKVSEDCLLAASRPRGTYTLTVPTGGGKTLASLRFALHHARIHGMERVIYISPYTSIIDQNAEVVRSILEPAGTDTATVVLEHHSNLTPVEQTWRSKVLSENWDAPVVFTTAVQFLEALFGSGTRAVRRMHRMTNAVLVFDEIQTLPIRCVHLFNNAINFLREQCGSSVLLCTATQPLLARVDAGKGAVRLSDNPDLIADIPSLFGALRRTLIHDCRKPGGWGHAEAAIFAIQEAERTGSCLVVVNTKSEARSMYKECRAVSRLPVVHLSTNMCPAHRLRRLRTIQSRLRRKADVICVSTQLIEAGVDISFGSAIRALAGLDSIAQTAGRCNRHGGDALGHVHVINLTGDLPVTLADIRIAQQSAQRVMDECAKTSGDRIIDLSAPELIERYFQYYFFNRRKDMDYPVGPDVAERDDTLLRMLADNGLAVKPPLQNYMTQAFMTAAKAFEPIATKTQGVIVPYTSAGKAVINELCASHEPHRQFSLLRRAQPFTVNVFANVLRRLHREGALHEVQPGVGILYLDHKYYSNEFGLNEEGTEAMEATFA